MLKKAAFGPYSDYSDWLMYANSSCHVPVRSILLLSASLSLGFNIFLYFEVCYRNSACVTLSGAFSYLWKAPICFVMSFRPNVSAQLSLDRFQWSLMSATTMKICWEISMDALPANRSWPPSCGHGTYQHKAITSRSRQLLMMGTWLPETCWATIRREIKNTKSDI